MTGPTVRVPVKTRDILKDLSRETGEPIQSLVATAVEMYRRQRILELTNNAYLNICKDSQAWEELLEERRDWETTLPDGLED